MALKEFKFKSKTLSELKDLSITELADFLPSRQRRTIKRGLSDDHKKLLTKIVAAYRILYIIIFLFSL